MTQCPLGLLRAVGCEEKRDLKTSLFVASSWTLTGLRFPDVEPKQVVKR